MSTFAEMIISGLKRRIFVKNKKLLIAVLTLVVVLIGGVFVYKAVFGVKGVSVDESALIEKISTYANPESFITPGQLNELMSDENSDVVVIGALNPSKGNSPIEGSFTMWRPDYSTPTEEYGFEGMRNETADMEEILSSYGATQESTIVVYAANDHHDAARLWWQVKMLGHENVKYLDGGLNAWAGAGYPTGNANPTVEATEYVAANPSFDTLANFEDVVEALTDENTVIIDTRTEAEEQGTTTSSGAFGPGKIEGSVWIEWTAPLNEDTTMKSLEEIQELYGQFEGKKIITYCQSGVRSAHTLFVLTEVLGFEDVYNYDGSWIEWSYEYYENNNPEAKVENAK